MAYVIGGGEPKIYPTKMEDIMKCRIPTNVPKVKSFVGAIEYLRKFKSCFQK